MNIKLILIVAFILTSYKVSSQSQILTEKTIEIEDIKAITRNYFQDFHFSLLNQIKSRKVPVYIDTLLEIPSNLDSIWFMKAVFSFGDELRSWDSTVIIDFDEFLVQKYFVHEKFVKITLGHGYEYHIFGFIKRKDFEKITSEYRLINWFNDINPRSMINKDLFGSFIDSVSMDLFEKIRRYDTTNFRYRDWDNDSNIIVDYYYKPTGLFYTYNNEKFGRGFKVISKIESVALVALYNTGSPYSHLSQKISIKNMSKYFNQNEIYYLCHLFFYKL